MVSQKALYWIAVALMALFLGHHFAVKYDRCLRTSLESSPAPAMVERVLDKSPCFPARRLVVPPAEAGFASLEAEIARQQAGFAHLEAERARILAMEQMGRVRGICPRPSVRIAIRQHPVADDGTI
jgi:hypothetical protein